MKSIKVIAASLILVFGLLAAPRAEAIEWNIGGHVKGGVAFPSDNDYNATDNPEWQLGFGGGANIFALIKVAYNFAVGGNVDLFYGSHSTAASGAAEAIIGSIGLKARLSLPTFHAGLALNYAFGAGTVLDSNLNVLQEPSYSGFSLTLDALYRFQLKPYRTFLEFGAFLGYTYLGDGSINATNYITLGIKAGVAFEFGRFQP